MLKPARAVSATLFGGAREALGYVRHSQRAGVAFVVVFMLATFSFNFNVLLPLVADRTLPRGAQSFGLIAAVFGAGALIGLWDYQDGVPGRGDHAMIPSMWYSVELQATTPVPEWGNQQVRSAQEEDVIIGADGKVRWGFKRQTTFHLIKSTSPLN